MEATDLIVVSRYEIEMWQKRAKESMADSNSQYFKGLELGYEAVLKAGHPLTPILEKAFEAGEMYNYESYFGKAPPIMPNKQQFLSSDII